MELVQHGLVRLFDDRLDSALAFTAT